MGRSPDLYAESAYTCPSSFSHGLAPFQSEVDFVRLGRLERIHPEVRRFSAEKLTQRFTSVAELQRFYESKVQKPEKTK